MTSTADFPTFATLKQIIDTNGHALRGYVSQPVDGCGACAVAKRGHATRWAMGYGHHQWIEPGAFTRKLRILSRRYAAEEAARYWVACAIDDVQTWNQIWDQTRPGSHRSPAELAQPGQHILTGNPATNARWTKIAAVIHNYEHGHRVRISLVDGGCLTTAASTPVIIREQQ